MENLSFTLGTLINLGGFLLATSALYWRIKVAMTASEVKNRLEIKRIDAEIANMVEERKEAWATHNRKQEKNDSMHADILKGVVEMGGDMKAMKKDIEWLREK